MLIKFFKALHIMLFGDKITYIYMDKQIFKLHFLAIIPSISHRNTKHRKQYENFRYIC